MKNLLASILLLAGLSWGQVTFYPPQSGSGTGSLNQVVPGVAGGLLCDTPSGGNQTCNADGVVVAFRTTESSGIDTTCLTAGTGSAYTCTPASLIGPSSVAGNALTEYTDGMRILFRPHTNGIGTPTLSISGLAAKNIYGSDGVSAPTLTSGLMYLLAYNVNLAGSAGAWAIVGGGGTSSVVPITQKFIPAPTNSAGNAVYGPDVMVAGTGFTTPAVGTLTNPARGYMPLSPTAGTPWAFVLRTTIPTGWNSAGVTKIRFYGFGSGVANSKTYSVEGQCFGNGDANTMAFSTAQTVVQVFAALSVVYVTELTLNSTTLAGCAANEQLMLRISRPDANTGDLRIDAIDLEFPI